VTALALAPAVLPGDDTAARLEALLDQGFLSGAGWDAQAMVLSPLASHPGLGWRVCEVPGCGGMAESRKGAARICGACYQYTVRNGLAGPPEAAVKTFTTGVGRCQVGCARPWESARRPLCGAHDHQQRVVLRLPVEEFLARPGVVPLPGFGPCQVLACTRLRYSRLSGFCKAHQTRWLYAARQEPRPDAVQWCCTEPAVAEGGMISLRGLPRLVVAEILYGLQRRCAEGVLTHRAVLRPLCDDLRRLQAGSITGLPEQGRRQRRDLLRSLADHRRIGLSSPDAEQVKDVWDLRVLGHRGNLDFTVIQLGWLRSAAKRWAAEDLPQRRGRNAPNILQYVLGSLAELDASLRLQNDDHGADPAQLGRRDIVAFTNRLAFLQQDGALSLNRRIDVLRHARTVITWSRLAGLTRPGGCAAGLPDDFGILKEDVPRKRRGDGPGRALPREIMQQLCDGLPKVADITSCEEVRVAIELMMDTGRRPEEACDLPWDCLEKDTNGKYVLVYDNEKCLRPRRELPVSDATAELVVSQQQRARGRYPHTPVSELKLLPAPKKNPRGTMPLPTATVNENHRAWVDALPPLVTRHGGEATEFDKAAVFPYAYRHTYAQRHADAGVPVDVLRELLDHDSMDTTQVYYRVGAERRREAVDRVTRHQFDRHGNHTWHQAQALLDATRARQEIGQVAVPYGICTEPSNVQAGGCACPFRFRCAGCDHFRTDVSYLPDLKAYLHDLLRDRERVLAATGLDEWARAQALPSEEEIRRIRSLIGQAEAHLDDLDDDERAVLEEASRLVRRGRQSVLLGMPRVRQPAPDLRLDRTS